MTETHILTIATELNLNSNQVRATAELLEQDATVPFIARYRKEATGSLDEVAITAIRDRLEQLAELDKRREAILTSLEENGHLTDELKEKVLAAETLAVLEDIYLPYRPRRRTRASIAREKGLEPLAQRLFDQEDFDPETEAETFIDAEKGVETVEDALSGARDIVAEWISEHADARARMRDLFATNGVFKSRIIPGKEEEGAKFKDYFEWDEPVPEAPSHRILAMRRGEKEGFLTLRIGPPEADAHALLESLFIKTGNAVSGHVRQALEDSYKRLLAPSMETEIRLETKKAADAEAIRIFTENLRELLLSPPLGQRNVLAIDPGFRTGCKLVCLNRQGKLLHTDTVYPGQGAKRDAEAAEKITAYCKDYGIEAVAIGNGTGGRELETFIRNLSLPGQIPIVMVNESGASVYSASEAAREEFADHDLTVRGSVSIGRRLMDPLAELVKIDPKSIGVGQYQHDVDQTALKKSLDDTVVSCVNAVGVEVNTASKQILTYVSGLGPQLAQNIVACRNETGPFASRKDLKNVPRLGPKAFEQAAGFLRIQNAENPLDASAVHPESYPVVESMAQDLDCSVADLIRDETLRAKIVPENYVTDTVGLPTIQDILAELAKPGRDPREQFDAFQFAEGVEKMEDLIPGMTLPGIVTNVTAFGAFVDVGVHQDGLVHISQLADRYVKDPSEIVKVHQRVTVTVLDVDLARRRISLSMRKNPEATGPARGDAAKPEQKSTPQKSGRKPQRKAEPERPKTAFAEALRKAGLS